LKKRGSLAIAKLGFEERSISEKVAILARSMKFEHNLSSSERCSDEGTPKIFPGDCKEQGAKGMNGNKMCLHLKIKIYHIIILLISQFSPSFLSWIFRRALNCAYLPILLGQRGITLLASFGDCLLEMTLKALVGGGMPKIKNYCNYSASW
ncbi:MAG: hypothetical protein KDD09_25235, partial [Phaeodactylibacter sp.]|nr:hypothetical protein [Phaeodactylibacter sp.]